MSESIRKKFTFHSQDNIKKELPKLYIKLKKNMLSEKYTELQKYMAKSRNMKSLKRQKYTPFTFNKNSLTKSTFYSKLESNSSTKCDYNNNNKYTITEMNQTYYNNTKNDNDCVLLSSLYNLPDYKRKTINFFLSPKNKSMYTARNNTIILNKTQNLSSICPKKEKKNIRIVCKSNNNFNSESYISNSNNKTIFTNINISQNNDNYKNIPKKEKYQNLEFLMKDKFYVDIKDRLNKDFIGSKFIYDNSVKNKIIELNQVSEFWGGVFDFSIPIICAKKCQSISKLIGERKKINAMRKMFNNRNLETARKYYNLSERKNTNKKIAKPYTVANFIAQRKKEINKEKIGEEMRKNKTEKQMKYAFNSIYIDQYL
jgi:hypothetical protein